MRQKDIWDLAVEDGASFDELRELAMYQAQDEILRLKALRSRPNCTTDRSLPANWTFILFLCVIGAALVFSVAFA